MTNPINPIAVTVLPPTSEPLVDQGQFITVDWYHCVFALFQRSGGTAGYDIATIQAEASEALTVGVQNAGEIEALTTQLNATTTTANHANTTANTAETTALAAQSNVIALTSSALLKADNLQGLDDVPTSRANLGLDSFPIILEIVNATSPIRKPVPLWRPLTFAANFAGSAAYAMTAPTSTIVMSLGYIRAGITTPIGSLTFFATGQIGFFSVQPEFSLETGDVLTLTGSSDPTLAGVGITLLTTLG